MKNILFLALVAFPFWANAQSGWTRNPHQWFLKLDVSHLSSDNYYNPNGNLLNTSTFQQTSLNFYGEYGIRDRLTLIAQAPLLRMNRFETTETALGQGDLRVEAKYRLSGNKWPLSISVAPEFPTGRANAFAANKAFPDESINLPTGDGEFNVWTTVAASKSMGKTYASVFAAYNFRTAYKGKSFRDLYQFGAELGFNPWKPLWVNAKLRAQFSEGRSKHPELGFVRGDGTTYTLASIEAFYKLTPKLGLALAYLSGGNWVAPFRNIYIAPYFSLGIVYEQ